MTNMRIKSEWQRHFGATTRHQDRIDHAFRKLYRDEGFTKQGGRCAYCKTPLTRKQATADHRVPISKGGSTSKDNIIMSCEPCNKAKSSMSEAKFRRALNERTMPCPSNMPLLLAWIRHRIEKRVKKAERRIRGAAGIPEPR